MSHEIAVACSNTRCRYSGQVRRIVLGLVGVNVLALPTLLCAGCHHVMADQDLEGVTHD